MKREERSQAFLRKRKMLLALPVLVIPFLTLAFWANGGGQGEPNLVNDSSVRGLNMNLPDSKVNEELDSKLSFYDKADKDSLKMAELIQQDPYYSTGDSASPTIDELQRITDATASKYNQPLNASPYDGATTNAEQKIMERIASLEREMNKVPGSEDNPIYKESEVRNSEGDNDMDRLEGMLKMINQSEDPQMAQIDNALEKILDIQHPDRVKERIKLQSVQHKEKVFPVSSQRPAITVSFFGKPGTDTLRDPSKREVTAFYTSSLSGENSSASNAIEAVVHASQVITNGSVVKLRLLNDVYINGVLIPKDNFVFGMATLNGERLDVEIHSIRYQQSLFPVDLSVHDLDGLEGIYVPGAITRDVAKESADNSLQMMELSTLSSNIGAQAASAGVNAAKTLFSRKVKLVKVTVKAGYKVLLRDNKDNQ